MKVLDLIRGLQRPALTIASGATILYLLITGKPIPGELWVFFSTVSGFTVAERAIAHARGNTSSVGGSNGGT